MDAGTIVRRARGAAVTAAVWGFGWFVAAMAVLGVMSLAGASITWTEAWQMAARTGVMGGIASGAFSLVIGLLYRGRRVADIGVLRFALGGGVVAGLFVPAFMLVARTLAGDGPLPLGNYTASALTAFVFGTVVAGVSLLLAQRADAIMLARRDRLDLGEGAAPFAGVVVPDRTRDGVDAGE